MVKHLTNPFAGRPTPLGTLIATAGRRLSSELDAALAEAGLADVRAAHAPLFMAIDADGSTVSELAQRARMTKQAMGELVRHLSTHGYLQVSVDPDDRRVRRVQLSDRGWKAIRAGERVIDDFDRWLEESVGRDRVAELREVLIQIADTPAGARPP